jgi:NADH dehydrogenase
MAGFFAWLMWLVVHLRSILGVRNKLIVLLNWMWNYFSYGQSLRLIIYAKKAKEIEEREKRLANKHWGTDLLSEGADEVKLADE